jgi:cytochrome c556
MMPFDLSKLFRRPDVTTVNEEAKALQQQALDALNYLHHSKDISQTKIAKYMRCQKQNVSEMLKGERPIPVEKLGLACVDLSFDLKEDAKEILQLSVVLRG